MPQGVACGVSNCAYWEQGNRCAADKITIEIDSRSNNMNEEFAVDFDNRVDKVKDSSATCCLTFRPADKKQKR